MSEHKPGVKEGFLVKHKLKLKHLTEDSSEKIQSEIDGMISVDGVWTDLKKQTIKLAYDASHHNIGEMINIIEKHGAEISKDWWTRLKLGWAEDTDNNVKENANHEPHCCSKMPNNYRR
jgi:hypothetical protein